LSRDWTLSWRTWEPAAIAGLKAAGASEKQTRTVFDFITSVSIALAVILCVMLIVLINRTYREQTAARILAEEGQIRTPPPCGRRRRQVT